MLTAPDEGLLAPNEFAEIARRIAGQSYPNETRTLCYTGRRSAFIPANSRADKTRLRRSLFLVSYHVLPAHCSDDNTERDSQESSRLWHGVSSSFGDVDGQSWTFPVPGFPANSMDSVISEAALSDCDLRSSTDCCRDTTTTIRVGQIP